MTGERDKSLGETRQAAERQQLGAGPYAWFSSLPGENRGSKESSAETLTALIALFAVILLPVVMWLAILNPGPTATGVLWMSGVVLAVAVGYLLWRRVRRRRSTASLDTVLRSRRDRTT